MMLLASKGHPWLAALLVLPASGFLVRIFIVFHDCCHGAMFRSRAANRVVGYISGLLTLTPFERWQQSHAEHHAAVGDLDRRGSGDVWTMTVAEFVAAPTWRKIHYRFFRNPFVMLALNPGLLFVVANRWPGGSTRPRERFSVHFVNLAMAATLVGAHFTVGLRVFLGTQLPTLLLAATAGVWLFYVQHQYQSVYWSRRPQWNPLTAAIDGSSYYRLPRVLQWVTGSIGLHHVHHVQPRIPFYNLQRCLDEVPEFGAVPALTVRESLRSVGLRLVDDQRGGMVSWAQFKSFRNDGEVASAGG